MYENSRPAIQETDRSLPLLSYAYYYISEEVHYLFEDTSSGLAFVLFVEWSEMSLLGEI